MLVHCGIVILSMTDIRGTRGEEGEDRVDGALFATGTRHWADIVADQVVARFPELEVYTCAAGISPSGIVHFGNFRDVITSVAVARALSAQGKNIRVIFSWDDFDRFRKVPANVDPSFTQYVAMPLINIPDPTGVDMSYARHFEKEFESSMRTAGIELEYLIQANAYTSGRYDEQMIHALQNRTTIANLLLSFMTEKAMTEKGIDPVVYRDEFYPISVYSRFTGKDTTKVIAYDGDSTITYRCLETKKEESIDLRAEHCMKLAWKVDWPMRWKEEGVVFEPGGKDHATPGGSYDVSSRLARTLYGVEPPLFVGYEFVGIQGLGDKMSGSKGNAVSPNQLLAIYEPTLLIWLYMRKTPDQAFSLSFDSEIYRQYEEFDREVARYHSGELNERERRALELAGDMNTLPSSPIPFRQAVAFGQIVQWNVQKLSSLLLDIGYEYDERSLEVRLKLARNWLETYNPTDMIRVRDSLNEEYLTTMSKDRKEHVRMLFTVLQKGLPTLAELEVLIYGIPKIEHLSQKENAPLQRAFFKDVYQLLISRDTGPRLATFLSLLPPDRVQHLLNI